MVPIGPDHGLMQRLADLGNIDTYSTELSSEEKVVELFPEPPSEKHLHIVVQCPGIAPSSPSGEYRLSLNPHAGASFTVIGLSRSAVSKRAPQ